MKTLSRISLFLLTIALLISCETSYRFKIDVPKTTVLEDKITVSVKEENGNAFEKVILFVNGKETDSNNGTLSIDTKDLGVGKQFISAMVYYGEGKSKRVNNSFEVFANTAYKAYKYKIVNTYPHDPKAFTQGLQYKDGILYESTGKYGESTIRKVELETGNVLLKKDIDEKYFGEGLTIMNDELHLLTWREFKGFLHDPQSLKEIGDFDYDKSKEGWGLTNDGTHLIKSDGTHNIRFLDPETHKEVRSIQVYTNKRAISRLNELEYINGKIFANWWRIDNIRKSSIIVVINPENGIVEAVIDLEKLRDIVEEKQKLTNDDVLNGIAYDAENNRMFVTGKNWSKLFEIELIEQ